MQLETIIPYYYLSTVALIETAPVITAGPEPIYKKLYSQVTLSCIASGNPQPGIQWFRDGLDIDGANTSQFIIKRLDLTTRGQYRCVARNHLGTASSDEVYVKIEGLFFLVALFCSIIIIYSY